MHFLSSLYTLGAASLASAAAITYHHNDHIQKLYARADVISEANGIHVHFEFTGRLDGKGTFVKIIGLQGLSTDPALGGPFGYHVHTNPIPEGGNCSVVSDDVITTALVYAYSILYIRHWRT